jgi:hypothetical protein
LSQSILYGLPFTRILEVKPLGQAHPWYTTYLPPGVLAMQAKCLNLREQCHIGNSVEPRLHGTISCLRSILYSLPFTRKLEVKPLGQAHPWYTKDLPPGVLAMQAKCLNLREQSSVPQTEEAINAIVTKAAKEGLGAPASRDTDGFDDEFEAAMVISYTPSPLFAPFCVLAFSSAGKSML